MSTRIKIPVASIDHEKSVVDNDALRQFILATMIGKETDLRSSNFSLEDAQRLLAHYNLHTLDIFNELVELEKAFEEAEKS